MPSNRGTDFSTHNYTYMIYSLKNLLREASQTTIDITNTPPIVYEDFMRFARENVKKYSLLKFNDDYLVNPREKENIFRDYQNRLT
jgi:hypothetical protein